MSARTIFWIIFVTAILFNAFWFAYWFLRIRQGPRGRKAPPPAAKRGP